MKETDSGQRTERDAGERVARWRHETHEEDYWTVLDIDSVDKVVAPRDAESQTGPAKQP